MDHKHTDRRRLDRVCVDLSEEDVLCNKLLQQKSAPEMTWMKQQTPINWTKPHKRHLTLFKNKWDRLRNPKAAILQRFRTVMYPCHLSEASEDLYLWIMYSNMVARIVANSKVNSLKIFRKTLDPQKNIRYRGQMKKHIHLNQAISNSSVNQKLLIL